MSFLYDPPLLAANGYAIGRALGNGKTAKLAQAGVLALFVGYSVGLYRNEEWTRSLWEACGAETGRDWMLNSGITAFDHEHPTPTTHKVAAVIFATYPLWLRWGIAKGRKRRHATSAAPERD